MRHESGFAVNLAAPGDEFDGFQLHALVQRIGFIDAFCCGEVAHVLGDFHRAETRAAHQAEVRDLAGLLLALMQELGSLGYAFIRSPDITAGHRSILSVLVHNYRNYETGHAHDP